MSEIGFLDGRVTAGMAAKALADAGYEARATVLSHGTEQVSWARDGAGRKGGSLVIEPHDTSRGEDLAPRSRLWTTDRSEGHKAIKFLAKAFGGVSLLSGARRDKGTPMRDLLENGGCYAFALHLHESSGLPLCALYDYWGNPQHVAVLDEEAGTVIDTRGPVPLREAAYFGANPCIGFRLARIDRDAVQSCADRNAEERGIAPTAAEMDGFIESVETLSERFREGPPGPAF